MREEYFRISKACTRVALLFCTLLLSGCGSDGGEKTLPPEHRTGLSVLSINLDNYRYLDRDGDFQDDDPKPPHEIAGIQDTILRIQPDMLCIREIGTEMVLDEFIQGLSTQELVYDYRVTGFATEGGNNLAVLSKVPFVEAVVHSNLTYRISGESFALTRPCIEVVVPQGSNEQVRLIHAHIRSNRPAARGDVYEMRRNEARLLTQLVRRKINGTENIPVILCGTLNVEPDSPLLNDLTGEQLDLVDTRPLSREGTAWTEWRSEQDRYERTDYMMVSRSITNRVETMIVSGESAKLRALALTFK